VRWLDLTRTFADEKGELPKASTPDHVPPQAEGYKRWADALEPVLKEVGL